MLLYKAIIAKPDTHLQTVDLPYGTDPNQPSPITFGNELRGIVGGWLEAIQLTPKLTMYINEQGKLQGLPFNPHATRIAHYYCLPIDDFIVGTAVIIGGPDEHGNDTPLAPDLHMELMEIAYGNLEGNREQADRALINALANHIVWGNG